MRGTCIFLRYIGTMFEVLVFVYENYYAGDSYPEPAHLERKLNAVGFESEEIEDALHWLKGLKAAASGFLGTGGASQVVAPEPWLRDPCPTSVRIYPLAEQNHLGLECMGFISFLESAAALSAAMRELIIDRAMAAPGEPVTLDDLKIIILLVYWSFGQEPDALILDELCDTEERVAN